MIAIIDYNKIQSLAPVKDTLDLEPFADKWIAFGWKTIVLNGHNHDELKEKLNDAIKNRGSQPICLIANTIKGKGVSFMENQVLWHYRSAQGEELQNALKELEGNNA